MSALVYKALVATTFNFLMEAQPPGKTFYPEAKETKEEAEVRYMGIAADLVDVVFDPDEKPLFSGPFGRWRTLTAIVGIAKHESHFRKDVQFQLGSYGKGDKGNSVCFMQMMVGSGKTKEGWTKSDLLDNKKCFRAGLHLMHESVKACWNVAEEYRYSVYTDGFDKDLKTCVAKERAKDRFMTGRELYKTLTKSLDPEWKDEVVLKLFLKQPDI